MWLRHLRTTALLLTAATAVANAEPSRRGVARTAWLAGKRAPNAEERRRQFNAGIASARALLAADPDDPEGLLWLAANLGAEALERGKLAALRVVPEMERLLLRLDARSPQYDHAAAARTLAVLYSKAPPVISIGSSAKARAWFEKALARAGDYAPTQILAAEFFNDVGDDDRARELAQAYLAHPVSPADHPDAPEWLALAQRLTRGAR